jgi:hypothetical protein
MLLAWAWNSALNPDGHDRKGAQVVEITDVLLEATRLRQAGVLLACQRARRPFRKPHSTLWLDSMRIIVRREFPHVGA